AHPAAPATVSALMSGFMLKIAIYGIIRILIVGGLNSEVLANLAFGLGVVSSFWGVLFALVQNDLKRLLAYSSVENVGLILLALAVCIKAHIANLPFIAVIALSAALFHCINHGLFKTLLFISAGALDAQAHSRDLRKLGGLAKLMPWTAFCFFIGSFSICSLPPFNGFASKWMLYQSLFRSTWQTASFIERGTAFAGLCILSAVGGLAIAVFAKAMGVAFLGQPRTKQTEHAKEGDWSMSLAQMILAAACAIVGIFADKVIPLLSNISIFALKIDSASFPLNTKELFPIPTEIIGLLLLSTTLLAYFALLRTSKVRKFDTWDCGFGPLSPRTQVSSESFAQPLARIFSPILKYQANVEISGKDRRHFPEHVKVETKMVSILETRVYLPTLAAITASSKLLVKLQAGSIHLYLLYLCITLIVLLFVGTNL
ncbi:MAG TPA: proton-conducting transporter membrane subunit, partial [Candidatus Melainabacteria bacterium]|nr:proton-conducting transporter membrane subunit [Candidatus Melainabacteria bacterium]